jgi:hypothetical protein
MMIAAWAVAQMSGAVVGISQWKVLGLWTVTPMAVVGLHGSFGVGIALGIPLWLGAAAAATYLQKLGPALALALLGVLGPWSLLLFSFPNC